MKEQSHVSLSKNNRFFVFFKSGLRATFFLHKRIISTFGNAKNILPIVLLVGIVVAAIILSSAYTYKFKQTEVITVTGAADTNFVSDLSVWSGTFSRTSFNMQEAYEALKKDEVLVMDYMQQQGLNKNEIRTSSIQTEKLFDNTFDEYGRQTGSKFNGYKLSESVTLESTDLIKIDKISRDITQLIQQGVELTSSSPNYYFTRLGDLKVDLLAKASADGRKRAETIAQHASSKLGSLKKASMGVFQITGQNENEDYSYGGAFNTSSINKTGTITVKMEFEVN